MGMRYELCFIAADLDKIKKSIESQSPPGYSQNANDMLINALNDNGNYLGSLYHSEESGDSFAKYITTIAGDYFSEPELYDKLLSRNDFLQDAEDITWGYVTRDEIKQFLNECSNKNTQGYFEDNDFQRDLEELEKIFNKAKDKNLDIICLYELI